MKELDDLMKKGCSKADLLNLRDRVYKGNSETRDRDLVEIDDCIDLVLYGPNSKRARMKSEAKRKLAVLIKELIGDRSIRRTAEDSGVAASYITGMLKEKYLPSADILRKLTAPDAKPQNAITLEDLMVAAGYQVNYVEEAVSDFIYKNESSLNDDEAKKDNDIESSIDRERVYEQHLKAMEDRHKLIVQEERRFSSEATGVIYKALAENGISFSVAKEPVGMRGFRPDMAIYVPKQPILEWLFDFKHLDEMNRSRVGGWIMHVRRMLGKYMFIEPKLERKISVVIDSQEAFETFIGYKDKLAYRGDLSIILIDRETLAVVREEYLAHYSINDTRSEFYITDR